MASKPRDVVYSISLRSLPSASAPIRGNFHHLESMYGVSYVGRMNRTELQNLAEERLADGELLLANSRYGAAYYIVGYAVECGLKACIAKLTRAEDFYDKILARKIFTHNLKELADHARLSDVFTQTSKKDQLFAANWAQVSLWSEESRYDAHTQQDAEQLIAAVRDPVHGVMQCIRQYW